MSDSRRRHFSKRNILMAELLFMCSAPVCAQQGPRWIEDPLGVYPSELRRGPTLPGDQAPLDCSTHYDPAQPLGLDRAADLALCTNPQARSTWEAIKIQAGALGEAEAAYLPTITGSLTLQRERNQYPDVPLQDSTTTGHSAYLAFGWRLFDFGERSSKRAAAQFLLSAAMASHDAQLQKILDAVIAAYFDATTARSVHLARSKAHELLISTLAATERRENKGAASHNDTLQTQVAVAKAALAERRALGEYNKSVSVLVYNLGLPVETRLSLPEMGAPTASVIGELSQWISQVQSGHPALIAARQEWEAATEKITSVRSVGRPTLELSGNYYQNGYPNQGIQSTSSRQTTVGLTINVPLFDGFSRVYQIQEAEAQASAAEAQYIDTEHQILMTLVKAHADAVSALGNIDSSNELLEASQAAEQSAQRRYANGAANIIELLTAQSNLADAEQERVQSLAEWNSARLRLIASAGRLGLSRVSQPLDVP
jgi:outer membrane protein